MVSYENQVGNSDLRLSATTQNIFSYENPKVENCDEMPVGIIRGPAGIVQTTNIRKTTDIQEVVNDEMRVGITQEYIRKVVHDVGEDSDFNSGPWIRAVEYMKSDGGIMIGYFANVNKFLKKGKLEKAIGIIKSCTPNILGDLAVTLKDVSGFISANEHSTSAVRKKTVTYPFGSADFTLATTKNYSKHPRRNVAGSCTSLFIKMHYD
ncbi:hypothetical protein CTI12_AA094690 [Artemisia annua]|uniref:Uncharacterized protein n=1 Tax=Artemisia annua TaxID=35608 RepID=A0A2U1PZ22_ARTAN|nr:hypothetical protein CTI12_AA094690 [Artemisia annua]